MKITNKILAKAPLKIKVDYLTPNKEYDIFDADKSSFNIKSDDGVVMFCLWEGCNHLDGENWTKIEQN